MKPDECVDQIDALGGSKFDGRPRALRGTRPRFPAAARQRLRKLCEGRAACAGADFVEWASADVAPAGSSAGSPFTRSDRIVGLKCA
jgi:hypothetical protein